MAATNSIWKYASLLNPPVNPEFQLTLGEGNTPLIQIDGIYFKREDLNPTGSVKDRGLAYQISALTQQGVRNFVISSSGNAAISAAAYCQLANAQLTVFVSPKIPESKLTKLKTYSVKIISDLRPISSAAAFAKTHDAYNLRASTDSLGPIGYQTIAYELQDQLPQSDAVFFPVSSATTILGVTNGYQNSPLSRGDLSSAEGGVFPQIHSVQTTAAHPLAKHFDQKFVPTTTSLATGLVAKIIHSQDQIINIIKQSHGSGWIVGDEQITTAASWLEARNIKTSSEGATALAGLFKAQETGWKFSNPICLLTGTL